MAQSDARFGYRAKLNREKHYVGRKFTFTCAPGMLCPIWEDIATPGDTYYIEHNLEFLRTRPLLAPAMVDVKVHFETFFVPIQMLYQPAEQTLESLTDVQSSNFDYAQLLNEKFPTLDWSGIVTYMVSSSWMKTSYHQDLFRLADFFGLNPLVLAQDPNSSPQIAPINDFQPSFFPWQFGTYNCIYEYWYRLDDKTQFLNGTFNFDKFYNSTIDFQPALQNPTEFYRIKQRPWDFDYFSSMYRSPIVSDANLQSILPNRVYQPLINKSTNPIDDQGNFNSVTPPHLPNSDMMAFSAHASGTYSSTGANLLISTASIRQMFANEKLSMITGRTRKTYDSQVLAHFGVSVPHDVKHDITRICRDTFDLRIGEVTSLSATSDATLGDLAGKGWSQGRSKGKVKFTAPVHGFLMTIFSVEPKRRYIGGFDRINALSTMFDFPIPEFDRLGNVPMYRYEAGFVKSGSAQHTDVIGWKERYYWNKRKYDRSSLAFLKGSPNVGVVNSLSAYTISYIPFTYNWVSQGFRPAPDQEVVFYIDRFALDPLMAVSYVSSWFDGSVGYGDGENWNQSPWLVYGRDPFIVDSEISVDKVSWMSKDGEPVYNF